MHPDLEKLKSLQEVDRQIQRLNDEIAALPRRVAAIEDKLAAHKAEVERHKAALKENELSRRKFEHEIEGEQQKISKYRDQSLEVKTNEQYKALMHEIEFAQQSIRAAEDRILQAMLDAEGHEKAIKIAGAELKTESAEVEKEKAEARARTEQDEKELAEWSGQRQQLRGGITSEVLAHYVRVVSVRKTALAEARGQHCLACNVMLRPQKYDEIRSNQHIMTCDSCSRILFYEPANEPAPAAEKSKKKKKPQPAETHETEVAAPSEV